MSFLRFRKAMLAMAGRLYLYPHPGPPRKRGRGKLIVPRSKRGEGEGQAASPRTTPDLIRGLAGNGNEVPALDCGRVTEPQIAGLLVTLGGRDGAVFIFPCHPRA